jgi:predicted DNA-binding protein with PD1-like motif
MTASLEHAHEILGVGTLFPDSQGRPMLHMHMACGRERATLTGCVRAGVRVWRVMEVVIHELIGSTARREREEPLGIQLLQP